MRALIVTAAVFAVALVAGEATRAAGGGGGGGGVPGGGGGYSFDPDAGTVAERKAGRAFSSAEKALKKAARYQRERAEETDLEKQAKLDKKANEQLERAVDKLEDAIEKKPDFPEAHAQLGFALRSLGRHDEALTAYTQALALRPGYPPAVEYRGEAYLELDRLDDAARAYQQLSRSSPDLATQLLGKMRAWVARKRLDPGNMDPGTVESFGRWVDRRSASISRGEGASFW